MGCRERWRRRNRRSPPFLALRRAPPEAGALEAGPDLLLDLGELVVLGRPVAEVHGVAVPVLGHRRERPGGGVRGDELVHLLPLGLRGAGRAPAPPPGADGAAAERGGHAHRRENDELHHGAGEAAAHGGALRRRPARHLPAPGLLPRAPPLALPPRLHGRGPTQPTLLLLPRRGGRRHRLRRRRAPPVPARLLMVVRPWLGHRPRSRAAARRRRRRRRRQRPRRGAITGL
ncbi:hypothetical protein PAHAL_3G502800 [Panicum hallii]|uniref:Uncharacterized protein n=1 Tax=Panicum hallii TaxID=206008 RepID=A0A2T8KM99_9POAL|nr:hypothetical protein PAHAL_3G502800 [Panicum hallii]